MLIILRAYRAATDLEPCLALWRRASEKGHPFLSAAELDGDAILVREHYMPQANITVAERDGRILGFIALAGSFIGGLFVDPKVHRSGIGKRLIEEAARQEGELTVEVYEANADALRFYKAAGFGEIGRRPVDDQARPHPLVRMCRLAGAELRDAPGAHRADV